MEQKKTEVEEKVEVGILPRHVSIAVDQIQYPILETRKMGFNTLINTKPGQDGYDELFENDIFELLINAFNDSNLPIIGMVCAAYRNLSFLNPEIADEYTKMIPISFLLNIKENSEVIDFLCRKGIDFISSIVKTADGHLWTDFDGAVLGVFNWIDGENVETDETKAPEYRMLAKIYSIPLDGCRIAREDFAGENAAMFFRQWKLIRDQEITSLLEHNRRKLEYRAEKLRYFADLCRKDTRHFYLTHGDAGGNFLVSRDKCFLVDWDGVLLAPPERDAWVMGFREWARSLFCESLLRNGIEYSLRPERLAYYCYAHLSFYVRFCQVVLWYF